MDVIFVMFAFNEIKFAAIYSLYRVKIIISKLVSGVLKLAFGR